MIGPMAIPKKGRGFSTYFKFCGICGKRYETPFKKGKKECLECREKNRKVHIHECKRCKKIFKDNQKVKSYCPDCRKPNRGQQQKLARKENENNE